MCTYYIVYTIVPGCIFYCAGVYTHTNSVITTYNTLALLVSSVWYAPGYYLVPVVFHPFWVDAHFFNRYSNVCTDMSCVVGVMSNVCNVCTSVGRQVYTCTHMYRVLKTATVDGIRMK